MGLDKDNELIADILNQTPDLSMIRAKLTEAGWTETNFGFNLGRKSTAVDLQQDGRFLIFLSSPSEEVNYSLLLKHNLPRFSTRYFNQQALKIGVADIPRPTRALDSLRYPETHPATGYLGAYEIIGAVAELLGKIADETSMTVPYLNLAKLAVTVGDANIIRLIPPIDLIPFSSRDKMTERLTNQLLRSLQQQDPLNDHTKQMDFFRYKLQEDRL